MNKKIITTIITCAIITSFSVNAATKTVSATKANEIKISASEAKFSKFATVDMGEVYQNYTKAKASQDSFNSLVENAQKELRTMMDEESKMIEAIQELQGKLNNPALAEDAKKKLTTEIETKSEEIRKKEADINQFRQETDQNLGQKRQAFVSQHLEEIQLEVNRIAKEKNFDLILNSTGMGVLYSNPSFDITTEVLKAVNDKAAAEAKPVETKKDQNAAEKKADAKKK